MCQETPMSLAELLPAVHSLPRSEKLQLMQVLVVDLAQDEGVPLLGPGRAYACNSQYDAFDAARVLMRVLEDQKGNVPRHGNIDYQFGAAPRSTDLAEKPFTLGRSPRASLRRSAA